MKTATLIARLLLAVIFIVFSANFWLKFIPMPPPPPADTTLGMFMGALFPTGYLAAVKALELLGGLLLLSRRTTCLGLLVLGPIILNILFFDLFLAKAFNPVSTLAAALALFLLYANRDRFAALRAGMKLAQNQVYRKGGDFLRIVELDRREVQFKRVTNLLTRDGSHHRVTKKEFCRLLKDATLLTQEEVRELWVTSPLREKGEADPAAR